MAPTLPSLRAEFMSTVEVEGFLKGQYSRLQEHIHLYDRLISLESVNELRLIAVFLRGIQKETLHDLENMTESLNRRGRECLRNVDNTIIGTHNDSIN